MPQRPLIHYSLGSKSATRLYYGLGTLVVPLALGLAVGAGLSFYWSKQDLTKDRARNEALLAAAHSQTTKLLEQKVAAQKELANKDIQLQKVRGDLAEKEKELGRLTRSYESLKQKVAMLERALNQAKQRATKQQSEKASE
jgi:chromosome segregation ATPase